MFLDTFVVFALQYKNSTSGKVEYFIISSCD